MSRLAVTRRLPGRRRRWRTAMAVSPFLAVTGLASLAVPAHAGTADRMVYVANVAGNSVSAIDTTTDTVTATIPVGSDPIGVAVSPDDSTVYVTNEGSDTVSVISTATNTVTATIPVGVVPDAAAVSPDGSLLYVGNNIGPRTGGIDVISTATDTVTATIATANQPDSIAFTADGAEAYVANFVGSSVSVINTATSTVTATIASPTAETPDTVAVTPDGAFAYVTNYNSNNVSVISTATNTITGTISGLSGPAGLSITPDGADVYVTNENNNTVSVISTATNTITDTIAAGSVPDGIVADPAGGEAYAANVSGNNVSVISTSTNAITGTVAVGSLPFEVAMAPAPPAVTAVSSSSGPAAGGRTVTITGTQMAGASAVDFGAIPATNVTVINDLTVTATVPAQAAGTVDITVTTPAGTSATSSADQYTYIAMPTITGISPASGPAAGGTVVTLAGTGLLGATVAFGTTDAASVSCTATSCTATAPAEAAGTVDVTVTTAGGTSATSGADRYAYLAPYPFTGFFSPVDNPPTVNPRIGGQVVFLRFGLGGDQGSGILASGSPAVQTINCRTLAPSGTVTPARGTLAYNPFTATYIYAWQTPASWGLTCRQITLTLIDGTTHTADFSFLG